MSAFCGLINIQLQHNKHGKYYVGNILKKVFCWVSDGTVCFSTYAVGLNGCTSTANVSNVPHQT